MLTSECEILLCKLQDTLEFAAAPDSLLVPPCTSDVLSQCEASGCVDPARFLRMFLGDSEAALALSVYQIEQPFVAYESDGFVYGIDHEGPHRTAMETMYRQPISPEELFAGAPEGMAFGLWGIFAAHIEAALWSVCQRRD